MLGVTSFKPITYVELRLIFRRSEAIAQAILNSLHDKFCRATASRRSIGRRTGPRLDGREETWGMARIIIAESKGGGVSTGIQGGGRNDKIINIT